MPESRLHELTEHGVSVWLDYLSRDILENGKLARMMDEDAVVGVTSNPTIFQKAISEGDAYDEQLREGLGGGGGAAGGDDAAGELREVVGWEDDAKEVFLKLAVQDVQNACDLLRQVWDGGKGQ